MQNLIREFDSAGRLVGETYTEDAAPLPVDIQKLAADLQVITAAVDDLILNALTEA